MRQARTVSRSASAAAASMSALTRAASAPESERPVSAERKGATAAAGWLSPANKAEASDRSWPKTNHLRMPSGEAPFQRARITADQAANTARSLRKRLAKGSGVASAKRAIIVQATESR